MLYLKFIVFAGLIRASRHFSEMVCATIWAAGRFAFGLMSLKPLLHNFIFSAVSFGVAFFVFRFLKETEELSGRWLIYAIGGGILLIYFL